MLLPAVFQHIFHETEVLTYLDHLEQQHVGTQRKHNLVFLSHSLQSLSYTLPLFHLLIAFCPSPSALFPSSAGLQTLSRSGARELGAGTMHALSPPHAPTPA